MKVIVVHVLAQRVGHGAVALVGVHDRRENVLLSAYDFYCGFVCVDVELFCEVIAAVVVKVGGVYVKDQLAVEKGVLFQSAGGDDPILFHLLKHLRISSGRFLEMNIEPRSFRDNILIDIGSLFPFVVLLRVADSGSGQPHTSCVGTMDTVASCHGHLPPDFRFRRTRWLSGEHFCGSVITHYDTFILRLQSIVGSPRGNGECGFCGSLCRGLQVVPTLQNPRRDRQPFSNRICFNAAAHRQREF